MIGGLDPLLPDVRETPAVTAAPVAADEPEITFRRLTEVAPEEIIAQMADPRVAEHLPLLTGAFDVDRRGVRHHHGRAPGVGRIPRQLEQHSVDQRLRLTSPAGSYSFSKRSVRASGMLSIG